MQFSGENMDPDDILIPASAAEKTPRKCLNGNQKRTLLVFLQMRSSDGKLFKGAVAIPTEHVRVLN